MCILYIVRNRGGGREVYRRIERKVSSFDLLPSISSVRYTPIRPFVLALLFVGRQIDMDEAAHTHSHLHTHTHKQRAYSTAEIFFHANEWMWWMNWRLSTFSCATFLSLIFYPQRENEKMMKLHVANNLKYIHTMWTGQSCSLLGSIWKLLLLLYRTRFVIFLSSFFLCSSPINSHPAPIIWPCPLWPFHPPPHFHNGLGTASILYGRRVLPVE